MSETEGLMSGHGYTIGGKQVEPSSNKASSSSQKSTLFPNDQLSENDVFYLNALSASVQARIDFIKKVYTILSAQLVFTLMVIFVFSFSENGQVFAQEHPGLLMLSFIASLVAVIALTCGGYDRTYPNNYILLGLFTFGESYLVGALTAQYTVPSVLQAIVITACITIGLTVYTVVSKKDFSQLGGILYCCLMALVIGGILRLFLPSTPLMETMWAMLGAALFSVYIVYDTFMIMNKLRTDQYILASINLYLDIINLFIRILQILGKRRK